jgi:glutamate N-acetyltransferase/amino-acid N-acetyltransferase
MTENFTCPGFKAAGIAAGIKKNEQKDLGLIYSEKPATVVGVFTKNRVKAAPVLLDKERINFGKAQAVIANSGNANCCTGEQGMQDAVATTRFVATGLNIPEELVMVASTGVIGTPMPMDKIEAAVPELIKSLRPNGFSRFAESIMTTDTVPKVVSRTNEIDGESYTVTAVAKGAGMIRPDMATMLCFVATDIQAPSGVLQDVLTKTVDQSLNRITIDGDTSTNDTVLLLASGMSEVRIQDNGNKAAFQEVIGSLLEQLSKMLVKDGEGVTKLVEVVVKGAATEHDAKMVAYTIAHSPLVKTAFFGADANWGRIMAASGRSGVSMDPDKIDIYFDDVMMVKNGAGCGKTAEAEATEVLRKPEFAVQIDLNMGTAEFSVVTSDLSVDYIKINADYRS